MLHDAPCLGRVTRLPWLTQAREMEELRATLVPNSVSVPLVVNPKYPYVYRYARPRPISRDGLASSWP